MSDFEAKMHQIRFGLWLRSRPRWGSLQREAYSAPPDLLAIFKGATSKGREGKGGKGWEGRKEEIRKFRRWRDGFVKSVKAIEPAR